MLCPYCDSTLPAAPGNGICPRCGAKLPAVQPRQMPDLPKCPMCRKQDVTFRKRGYRWWLGLIFCTAIGLTFLPLLPQMTAVHVWVIMVPCMGLGFLIPLKGMRTIRGHCRSCGHTWDARPLPDRSVPRR